MSVKEAWGLYAFQATSKVFIGVEVGDLEVFHTSLAKAL